jgi:hypothetical protein
MAQKKFFFSCHSCFPWTNPSSGPSLKPQGIPNNVQATSARLYQCLYQLAPKGGYQGPLRAVWAFDRSRRNRPADRRNLAHTYEKKGSLTATVNEPCKIAPLGFEPRLIESESIGDGSQSNEIDGFPALADDASASASPKLPKDCAATGSDSSAEPDVIAALVMIERLPLSDAEKAEIVRRLLAAQQSRS